MKKTFTKLFLTLTSVLTTLGVVNAQINAGSVVPVDFLVNSPATIAAEYAYGTQTETWGPELTQTVTGDLIWSYDVNGDSTLCEDAVTDLTGKMALIRRGGCFFSQKVWQAQQRGAIGAIICNHYDNATEDGDYLIGMSAANEAPWDSLALEVTIPAIFVSRNTCEALTSELDNGQDVNVSFAVRAFTEPVAAYSYHTPVDGVRPLTDMGITFFNLDTNVLPALTINLDITDPDGTVSSFSQTENDLDALTGFNLYFNDFYLPEKVGEYNLHYTNDLTAEEFDTKFVVTDDTYAQDNNDIFDWIATSNDGFVTDGFRYDFGNFYRTSSSSVTLTHVSFQLFNAADIFTGDPDADLFQIRIYDADPDGNGTVPGDAQNYDDLNEAGNAVLLGFANYSLTGNEGTDEKIIVELDEPTVIGADKIILVVVQYDGLNAGLGIPPWYAYGGTQDVAPTTDASGTGIRLGSAVFTDRLYTGGWSGGWKGVIRAHTNAFVSSTEALDNTKVVLGPNPTSDELNLTLELEKVATEVTISIVDFNGRLISTEQIDNVQSGTFTFDVSDLAAGSYFMGIDTPEGFRAKKFVVVR